MRPVDRGACPCDEDGKPVSFYPDYTIARGELIKRLGEYCSFCESRIQAGLHVEHILPKRPVNHSNDIQERVGDWNNFLLACVNCNSRKSNREFADGECMFPDRCDTFSAIMYGEGGQIKPSALLSQSDQQRVLNLIKLVGLDEYPTEQREQMRMSDRRWLNRFNAWKMAKESCKDIENDLNNINLIDRIIQIAMADGHWSIWMTVFKNMPIFLEKLLSQFPGTERKYFHNV